MRRWFKRLFCYWFAKKIITNQKELDPKYVKVINDNLFDLI